eukprot:gene4189-4484_t
MNGSLPLLAIVTLLFVGLRCTESYSVFPRNRCPPFSAFKKKEEVMLILPSRSRLYYVPPEVGPDIYIGAIAGVIPFIWATYQFTNRIKTQRECAVCGGSGLVKITKSGKQLDKYRKCWNCGGLLPWISWRMFFISSIREIGNGGPLQQPARDYKETNERFRLFEENSQSYERDKDDK